MYSDVIYAFGFGLSGAILFLLVDKYQKSAVAGNLLKFSILAVSGLRDPAQTAWLQVVFDRTRLGSGPLATIMSNQSGEETDNTLLADDRNYYKVEKWTKDGTKVDRLLYAGSNLDRVRVLFESEIKRRPRIRLTIRQQMRVLAQWPEK
jgi:hypothetical protein